MQKSQIKSIMILLFSSMLSAGLAVKIKFNETETHGTNASREIVLHNIADIPEIVPKYQNEHFLQRKKYLSSDINRVKATIFNPNELSYYGDNKNEKFKHKTKMDRLQLSRSFSPLIKSNSLSKIRNTSNNLKPNGSFASENKRILKYAAVHPRLKRDILTQTEQNPVFINNTVMSRVPKENLRDIKKLGFLKQHKFNGDTKVLSDVTNNKEDILNFSHSRTDENQRPGEISMTARTIDDAVGFGVEALEKLLTIDEPKWYEMGLILDKRHPASKVAAFGKPNEKAMELSKFGYVTLEASRKIAESFPGNANRQSSDFQWSVQSRLLRDDCPLKGQPRCPLASRRYRTADGTCNNIEEPRKGSALLPLQRFLPPVYDDGIQSVRRSVLGPRLPSPRTISSRIHSDRNHEIQSVTLMFMQWGQLIDHDVTSVVKSRSFNGSVPRCCDRSGREMLPPELTHPSCLPIKVPNDDWFFGQFGIKCMEFVRSAPSTRINCDLGWREQINQVTPFIDASTIYGSDIETSDSVRTFKNGKILYGRPHDHGFLQPPDPPGGELCRSGAITTDCFQPGDGRVTEQPGLVALHTVWIRYHNKVATVLSRYNPHWSDEKVFQETRKIIYSLVQHITYHEFLPVLLGPEVVKLFELNLVRKGYYDQYSSRVNPAIANSFSAAAYRFGHSMVQNSYVRADHKHRPIFNNVSLHEELDNFENIWSIGSVDRLLLGFCNQPSQRRDEFVCDELSNHLFQSPDLPFGMDLTAINIQRGRDHGIPAYTSWRQPCGLSPVNKWKDLEKVFSSESVRKFRSVYRHVDDIDLFSGGLAEKPVRGGIVGPTLACIIAQQFFNLRKGDRFWYENGGMESSLTPAQLQQIRQVSLAHILCQTMDEIETIQPLVFLSPDSSRNVRLPCDSPMIRKFDLVPWIESRFEEVNNNINLERQSNDEFKRFNRSGFKRNRRHVKNTVKKPQIMTTETYSLAENKFQSKYSANNVLINAIPPKPTFTSYPQKPQNTNQETNLYNVVHKPTTVTSKKSTVKPLEINIKIKYFLPSSETSSSKPPFENKKRPANRPTYYDDSVVITQRPTNNRPELAYPANLESLAYNDEVIGPTNIFGTGPNMPSYESPSVNRPNHVYNRPTYSDSYRPTSNYDTEPSIYHVNKYSYNDNEGNHFGSSRPERFPQNANSDSYAQNSFQNAHFSTSGRPYLYNSQNDRYTYNEFYSSKKPQQNSYDNGFSSNFQTNNKPNYDRGDNVYTQLFMDEDRVDIPARPSFSHGVYDNPIRKPTMDPINDNIRKPSKVYSIGHVYKLDYPNVNDKLDFKTRVATRYKDANSERDMDERPLVKISSVKSEAILLPSHPEINAVSQREGNFDLYENGETGYPQEDVRLVDIDVTPSEESGHFWLVFNETDEIAPLLQLPDINLQMPFSEELPKPIGVKKTIPKPGKIVQD